MANEIGSFSQLQELTLQGCELPSAADYSWHQLTSLKRLLLIWCDLDYECVAALKSLEFLSVTDLELSSYDAVHFSGLPSLTDVELQMTAEAWDCHCDAVVRCFTALRSLTVATPTDAESVRYFRATSLLPGVRLVLPGFVFERCC